MGMSLLVPEHSSDAVVKFPHRLHDSEKLNVMAFGVREAARGHGVSLALACYSLVELAQRGAKYLSLTLGIDTNWPARRTAEKLGAFVCANYVTYRRLFR